MTDNEIIKALECCSKVTNCEVCCDRKTDCMLLHMHEVIDLINRQKEEIERLQEKLNSKYKWEDMLDKKIKEVKADAIKEFEKRLEERLTHYGIYSQYVKDTIKQIVKEMTDFKEI